MINLTEPGDIAYLEFPETACSYTAVVGGGGQLNILSCSPKKKGLEANEMQFSIQPILYIITIDIVFKNDVWKIEARYSFFISHRILLWLYIS